LFALKIAVGGSARPSSSCVAARRLALEAAVADERGIDGQARGAEAGDEPATTLGAYVVRLEPGDHRDAPVSKLRQVSHGLRGPFRVRDRHQVDVRQVDRAVQHDERHARLQEVAVDALAFLRGDNEQASHAFGAERVQVDALAIGRSVRVGQQHRVPVLLDFVVDAADDGGEEQILDVGDEHADRRALSRAQRTRGAVGLIVQGLGGVADQRLQLGADAARLREHARHGGRGDAGHRRHLADGGRRRHVPRRCPGRRILLAILAHGPAS
jgi:hypothetical protein